MIARIDSVIGRSDNIVAVDPEAGLGDHYVVDAVVVKTLAPVLIGAALYRILGLIFDIEEVFGRAAICLGVLFNIEVAHYHRGQRTELRYLVEHNADALYPRLFADMIEVRVEHDEFEPRLLLLEDNIAANSIARGIPVLAHLFGSLGEPERAFVDKVVEVGAVEHRAALGESRFVAEGYDRVIALKRAAHIIILPLCRLLEADNSRRFRFDVLDDEIGAVEPALFARVRDVRAAQIAAHDAHLPALERLILDDRGVLILLIVRIVDAENARDSDERRKHDTQQADKNLRALFHLILSFDKKLYILCATRTELRG